jgi:hypothetical protein
MRPTTHLGNEKPRHSRTSPSPSVLKGGDVSPDTIQEPAMTKTDDIDPNDRDVIERLGAKKILAFLEELGAVYSVWGSDANDTLFFGWVIREGR